MDDRRREVQVAAADYERLKAQAEKNGWDLDAPFDPQTMKRVLFDTPNISQVARKSLSNRYFERIINDRIESERPFTLHYIINSASSLDWNVLDLFYRITGFDHFKQMFDLAELGTDEGPVCNLGLISQYLARYLDNYTSILTGRFVGSGSFLITFFMAYLYAIFRLGESEYEDADDPFPKGRIPFLTIHQSKGLEFPVVVVPSPAKKNFPPSKSERVRSLARRRSAASRSAGDAHKNKSAPFPDKSFALRFPDKFCPAHKRNRRMHSSASSGTVT